MMSRCISPFLALWLFGCSAPDLDAGRWTCETHADCGPGYQCDPIIDHCVSALDGIDGVFADRLVLGMSAAVETGAPLADVGKAAVAGVRACFAHFNVRGGVHGRQLELVVKNDSYDAKKTAANVGELIGGGDRQSFALLGVIGTEPAMAARKLALEERVLFFGPATGFDGLEPDPPDRYVFNVRPRYSEEASQLASYLILNASPRVPATNLAVFAQGSDDEGTLDTFGASGFAGVAAVLEAFGVAEKDVPRVSYATEASKNVTKSVHTLLRWMSGGKRSVQDARIPVGIVMVTIADAAVALISELEDALAAARKGLQPDQQKYGTFDSAELGRLAAVDLQLTSLSTVDLGLASSLKSLGRYTTKDTAGLPLQRSYGEGLLMALPVPPLDSNTSGIVQYRDHMKLYQPNAPVGFVSLEAYITALLLVEGLKRHGPDITTEALIDTLETLAVDFGIGTTLKYSRNSHQASDKLWGARMKSSWEFESIGVLVQ